jgi:hypothetical protein
MTDKYKNNKDNNETDKTWKKICEWKQKRWQQVTCIDEYSYRNNIIFFFCVNLSHI